MPFLFILLYILFVTDQTAKEANSSTLFFCWWTNVYFVIDNLSLTLGARFEVRKCLRLAIFPRVFYGVYSELVMNFL